MTFLPLVLGGTLGALVATAPQPWQLTGFAPYRPGVPLELLPPEHQPFPMARERLRSPVYLVGCPGVVIREWRGSRITVGGVRRLARVCATVMRRFPEFLAALGRSVPVPPAEGEAGRGASRRARLRVDVALLPPTREFRGLNDVDERFRYAHTPSLWGVVGYTLPAGPWGGNRIWVFMTSDLRDRNLDAIWAHELFHALDLHHGLHEGFGLGNTEKRERQEELAEAFGEFIGLTPR